MKKFQIIKCFFITTLLLQCMALNATSLSDPYSANLIRIQLNYVPGHDLPISTPCGPTKAPANGCPVKIFYDPLTNSLSFSSNCLVFNYHIYKDEEEIAEGSSNGIGDFSVSLPNDPTGSYIIDVELANATFEGLLDI